MRLFLISVVLVLVGCGPNIVFEQTYTLGSDWSYDEVLAFEIDVQDTLQMYDLQFILEHSADYGYQNLYVQITTMYPDGAQVEDEVSLQMANKLGEFNGDCRGSTCDITVVLQEQFRFQQLGIHNITIAQYSRNEVLPGINSGQLRLIEHQEKGK